MEPSQSKPEGRRDTTTPIPARRNLSMTEINLALLALLTSFAGHRAYVRKIFAAPEQELQGADLDELNYRRQRSKQDLEAAVAELRGFCKPRRRSATQQLVYLLAKDQSLRHMLKGFPYPSDETLIAAIVCINRGEADAKAIKQLAKLRRRLSVAERKERVLAWAYDTFNLDEYD